MATMGIVWTLLAAPSANKIAIQGTIARSIASNNVTTVLIAIKRNRLTGKVNVNDELPNVASRTKPPIINNVTDNTHHTDRID